MKKEIELRYTDTARERLEVLKESYVKEIERWIREKKYVPGETLVEVTLSDIETAANHVKIIAPRRPRIQYFIIYSYLIAGITTMLIGLFYGEFMRLFSERPLEGVLVMAGAAVTLVALILLLLARVREGHYQE